MNTLKGIIYLSKATIEFNEVSLLKLATEAAKRNQLSGITGYLYFVKGTFFQYFEGDEESVKYLWEKIAVDPRHKIVNTLHNQDISNRKFPSWNMKYITNDMLTVINLENLVIERMEYIKKINDITQMQNDYSEKEEAVWRMVDKISRLANSL